MQFCSKLSWIGQFAYTVFYFRIDKENKKPPNSPPDTDNDEEQSEKNHPIGKRMGERQPLMELNMDPEVDENSNNELVTPIRYQQETNLKSHSSNEGIFLDIQYWRLITFLLGYKLERKKLYYEVGNQNFFLISGLRKSRI